MADAPSPQTSNDTFQPPLQLPQEKYLVDAAAHLADQLIYRPAQFLTSNDRDQASKAMMILKHVDPVLTPATLAKLLRDLSWRWCMAHTGLVVRRTPNSFTD